MVKSSLEAEFSALGDRKRKKEKISILGDQGPKYLLAKLANWGQNLRFEQIVDKNYRLTVDVCSQEAEFNSLGDRKRKNQKI